MAHLTRLYPLPATRALVGTYLEHALRECGTPDRPFGYTNFIASLDGRIAWRDPRTGHYGVPRDIANDLDWRLYLELAAQADAVVTSARRLRELATRGKTLRCVPDLAASDLARWRRDRGLAPYPACIVLTQGTHLPLSAMRSLEHDELFVLATTEPSATQRQALDDAGVTLIPCRGSDVTGAAVLALARERGYRTLYSIGGPTVFRTLLAAGALQRLYLTHAHRLLAGTEFDTVLAGAPLVPATSLRLHELYLCDAVGTTPQMLFGSYDVVVPMQERPD